MTAAEAVKLEQNPLKSGVVLTFASQNVLSTGIPIIDIQGNALAYTAETTLPTVGTRAVGSEWTAANGVLTQSSETLRVLGGTVDVDRFSVQNQSNTNVADIRASHTALKAKSLSRHFNYLFFKGDNGSDPTAFDGLEQRVGASQIVDISAGGGTLTLAKLDEAIDMCEGMGQKVIFANRTLRRKISTLARAANQAVEPVTDIFGQQLGAYAGIPIYVVGKDSGNAEILDFDEDSATPGSQACSSIYVVSLSDIDGTGVIQNPFGIQVTDLGLLNNGTVYRTIIEWYVSMAVFNPNSAIRVRGITNT